MTVPAVGDCVFETGSWQTFPTDNSETIFGTMSLQSLDKFTIRDGGQVTMVQEPGPQVALTVIVLAAVAVQPAAFVNE